MRGACVILVLLSVSVCECALDQLMRARCAATCIDHPKSSKTKCESQCGLMTRTKPGKCPSSNQTWYQTACLVSCSSDADCPDTEKCCTNDCGVTCQHALGLDTYPGLPVVPVNLTVMDSQKQRSKLVQWQAATSTQCVFYVVQVRRSAGHQHRFEPWKTRLRRRRNSLQLADLTPGHWYQFRVATVNANGSRGYSDPSEPFKLNIGPARPEEPRNLTVSRPGWVDGRLWVELRWKRPRSDLPLRHYRVYCSHCVKAEDSECKVKSVVVKRTTLNYTRTNYILKDLVPHARYFIQVQAITMQYSSKKLSSEKADIFIDTTNYKNATYDWRLQPKNQIKKLKVVSFYRTTPERLVALLTWESDPGRFFISWSPLTLCPAAPNNPTYEATTEEFQYDIDHLAFNCKYQIVVKSLNSNKSTKLNITTPLCKETHSKYRCL